MNSCKASFPKTAVPGLPLDCSSSTSSSSKPQPAVSMSSKGIVVSSVEATPGRSLQKVLGKGQLTALESGQKGHRLSGCLLLPATQQGQAGKHSWVLLPRDKAVDQPQPSEN